MNKTGIRSLLRKLLAQALAWTQEKAKEIPVRRVSFLRRDVHIPPVLTAVLSIGFFWAVFAIQSTHSALVLISLTLLVLSLSFLLIAYLRYDFSQLIQDDEAVMLISTL